MELMKAIGQRAIEKTVSDPRARTFLGRAGLIARALMGETSHVEFPVVDLVAKSMGMKRASVEQNGLWNGGGWIAAVDFPPEATEADRKAVGDAVWEFVREQVRLERWAYERESDLVAATIYEDDPDDYYDELDRVSNEHAEASSLARQGKEVLAHLGDERAGRLVPEG